LIALRNTGRGLLMLMRASTYLPQAFSKRSREEVFAQLFMTGVKSLGVITIVALFTGMILALQAGLALRDYGQEANISTLVSVTMLREMGPFMTGLILAASVGSAICAQLGTMTVSEEIAALEVMSIDPHRFLVMPRLFALSVMAPAMTIYANMVGIIGGSLVGAFQLGVSFQKYVDNAFLIADFKDLFVGVFKAYVFGLIITTVACYQGFVTREGAVGVGRNTRKTVVVSFLLILVMGYFITGLFYR
jgi:phospholipid/cholesterol/gamma-HCH transport system permease protein